MSPDRYASGWTVHKFGDIYVDTVSHTKRGAKVNFLTVHCGVFVTAVMSDEKIEELWVEHAGSHSITEVRIELDLP